MGPPRFELGSEDPQSPRMPGYPMAPFHNIFSDVTYVLNHVVLRNFKAGKGSHIRIVSVTHKIIRCLTYGTTDTLISLNNKPLNNKTN